MAYDCFGAGQKVTQTIYAVQSWRNPAQKADQIFSVFLAVHQLHQMWWYLSQTACLLPAQPLAVQIGEAKSGVSAASVLPAEGILSLDIECYRRKTNQILKQALHLVSNAVLGNRTAATVQDGIGKDFRRFPDLQGIDCSMSLLIAANFEGCDLYGVNFLRADLQDANLKGADLRNSLFLTQVQINAAKGDANTLLPPFLYTPPAWGGHTI